MNSSLSSEEVSKIVNEVAAAYGVEEDDVVVEVVYETSGTMEIDVRGDVSEEELRETIQDELANLLGIHESNIEVSITNGTAHFTIKSDSAEIAKDIRDALSSESSAASLKDSITKALPEVTISDVKVEESVKADVLVTVDTSNAANNLEKAATEIKQTMENEGYEATAKSKFCSGE